MCASRLLSNPVILSVEMELSTNVSLDDAITEFSGVDGRILLNQAHTGRLTHAWFLEITFIAGMYMCMCVCVCVCVCMCVYVYAPKAIVTSDVILTLYDWLNNFLCFSVLFHGSCCRCH